MAVQASAEEVEYKPPSESEFAASVAKDMAGEVFSSSRIIWVAIAILIIIILVVVVLTSGGGG